MKVIVLTPDNGSFEEIPTVISLFEQGLPLLHLKKTKFGFDDFERYLKGIPLHFHNRIVVHGHYRLAIKYKLAGVHLHRKHRSGAWKNQFKRFILRLRYPGGLICTTFHSLHSLRENRTRYDYVILSKVFNDKTHYSAYEAAGINLLKTSIRDSKTSVVAMGGVTATKLDVVKAAGFSGVGLSSAMWDASDAERTALLHLLLQQ